MEQEKETEQSITQTHDTDTVSEGEQPSPTPPAAPTAGRPGSGLLTPLAILIGFVLVAGAIFLKDGAPTDQVRNNQDNPAPSEAPAMTDVLRKESPNIYGDSEAPITIVEFSDYECPFCARLHPTLKRIVDESDGDINWEYRHLPLRSHKNAMTAAIIGECVAEHAGNDAFWSYTGTVFTDGPGEASFYEQTATELGVDQATLDTCLNDTDLQAIVQADLDQAQAIGASGTPFNVIVFPDDTMVPVRGALPYQNWMAALDR